MKLYLSAIMVAFAATVVILNVCVMKATPTRAAPLHIVQFN